MPVAQRPCQGSALPSPNSPWSVISPGSPPGDLLGDFLIGTSDKGCRNRSWDVAGARRGQGRASGSHGQQGSGQQQKAGSHRQQRGHPKERQEQRGLRAGGRIQLPHSRPRSLHPGAPSLGQTPSLFCTRKKNAPAPSTCRRFGVLKPGETWRPEGAGPDSPLRRAGPRGPAPSSCSPSWWRRRGRDQRPRASRRGWRGEGPGAPEEQPPLTWAAAT